MTTNPPQCYLESNPNGVEDLAMMLRRKIRAYKKARPNLSSHQIAKKFGMSSATFSRIENLDIKNPTFDQVIKVLTGTGDHKDVLAYLKMHYPQIARIYSEGFSEKDESMFLRGKSAEYMTNPRTSKLMIMALSECGLKKSVVKDEFGNEGLRTLDFLIEKGILYSMDGELFRPKESGSAVDMKTTKALVNRALNDFYDVKGYEERTSMNFLSFQSESINLEKVYPMIISLLSELQQNVRTIFNDPSNKGEETVFVSMISDSLIKNDLAKYFNEGKI